MDTLEKPVQEKPARRGLFRRRKSKRPTTWQGWLFFVTRLLLVAFVAIYIVVSIVGAEIFTMSPNRSASTTNPADYQLSYQDVSFPAAVDNLTIRGWFVPKSTSRVIIVLHGKDGNRGVMLEPSVPLAKLGYSLLLIDTRGHGLSDGSNYSYGFYEQRDVQGALTWLEQKGYQPGHIGIYGGSMGAATGLVFMGAHPEIGAMVSDSSYARLDDELAFGMHALTKGALPPFFLPGMEVAARVFQGIDINAVRPEESVTYLNGRHILLIHCTDDALVPVDSAYRIKNAAGSLADLWIVPGGFHTGAYNTHPTEYVQRLEGFFITYLPLS